MSRILLCLPYDSVNTRVMVLWQLGEVRALTLSLFYNLSPDLQLRSPSEGVAMPNSNTTLPSGAPGTSEGSRVDTEAFWITNWSAKPLSQIFKGYSMSYSPFLLFLIPIFFDCPCHSFSVKHFSAFSWASESGNNVKKSETGAIWNVCNLNGLHILWF